MNCPPTGFLNQPEVLSGVLANISSAVPAILFVALGAPQQEYFIQRYIRPMGVPVAMGVGGSFEMIAGVRQRAPQWMRRAGMEWIVPVGTGAKTLVAALPGGQFSVLGLYAALLNARKSQVISPMKTERTPYFEALDGLRAFSVLLVIYQHAANKTDAMKRFQGNLGVDIFFVSAVPDYLSPEPRKAGYGQGGSIGLLHPQGFSHSSHLLRRPGHLRAPYVCGTWGEVAGDEGGIAVLCHVLQRARPRFSSRALFAYMVTRNKRNSIWCGRLCFLSCSPFRSGVVWWSQPSICQC